MALSAAGLSAAIVAQLGTASDAAKQKDFADKLAAAIVTYLVANATVAGTIIVTTGPGAPGTGTATGTIS